MAFLLIADVAVYRHLEAGTFTDFSNFILLIVCGMAIIYSQHRGFLGRDGGTSLFVIALGLKLMEIKTERDLYLIN
ncbi:MAG: hypothetical protein O2966_03165 [Proteobacteria bacterium]|nr:hypothetical protein [Pseudomonadota bacterium]